MEQATDRMGRINPNECVDCLKCQVTYRDPQTWLPLKMRARQAQGSTAATPAKGV
ncbi:MAG TPA: hypothetical protein VKN76_04625 [Kiloniellaceae bacterium]|nr:hypothetical protein [Kiloniellaceae bacterium]